MATSPFPVWQAEVQAANDICTDDPFERDLRVNARLGFVELIWPLVCTVIRVACGVLIVRIGFVGKKLILFCVRLLATR